MRTSAGGVVTATVLTHNGAQRSANEDAVVVGSSVFAGVSTSQPHTLTVPARDQEPVVVAVADGLGGHQAGEVAAAHVVARLARAGGSLRTADDIAGLLPAVSAEVAEAGTRDPARRDMGTTIAGLLLSPRQAVWFNVGDSRVYRLSGGYLGQLSVDDTPEAALAEAGESPVPAGVVTQAIGTASPELLTHTGIEAGPAGGSYLICSDGLSDLVGINEIEQIVAAHGQDDPTAVKALWAAAMNAGGRDNITIVLVRVQPSPPEQA
jgi:PPM family protein phosphatase